jgi:hypothetical protein
MHLKPQVWGWDDTSNISSLQCEQTVWGWDDTSNISSLQCKQTWIPMRV